MGDLVTCLICNHKYHPGEKRCLRCGAVYPQSHTDQFNFYSQLYNDKHIAINYLRRGRIYETIANKILHINKIRNVSFLDIGASVGISIVLLEQYGKARGIELNIPSIRRWHKFLDIESAMMYINEDNDIAEFYEKKLDEKVDFVFIIDTLRYIPLPTVIDSVVKCIRENGAIVIREVNPDNIRIFEERISGRHGDVILYSPRTIRYLAGRNELNVSWYLVSSAIDNLAISLPYNMLRLLKPPNYVALLRRKAL